MVSDVYVDHIAFETWLFVSLHGVPILTFLPTHSLQHGPSSVAKRLAAIKEVLHILWNPNANHSFHNNPTPVQILSQIYPGPAPKPSSSSRSILTLSCTKSPSLSIPQALPQYQSRSEGTSIRFITTVVPS